MKVTSLLIVLLAMVSISVSVDKAGAIVAVIELRQQQQDGIVMGVYEGYKNYMINILLSDGTHASYPVSHKKQLLRRIAGMSASSRISVAIKHGEVVQVGEGSHEVGK
jgi:hypothetical protein